MPVEQKIDYVQALWRRILSKDSDKIPSPDWHRDEVHTALAEHGRNPEAARPWAEVRTQIEAKLKRQR